MTIIELLDSALADAHLFGVDDDGVTKARAEIERRLTEVRKILVDGLGDCLPVRILDGRP